MTVGELIERLKVYPSDMLVVAAHYESDWHPVTTTERAFAWENPKPGSYQGPVKTFRESDREVWDSLQDYEEMCLSPSWRRRDDVVVIE